MGNMQHVKGIKSMKKYLFPNTVSLPMVTQGNGKEDKNITD